MSCVGRINVILQLCNGSDCGVCCVTTGPIISSVFDPLENNSHFDITVKFINDFSVFLLSHLSLQFKGWGQFSAWLTEVHWQDLEFLNRSFVQLYLSSNLILMELE